MTAKEIAEMLDNLQATYPAASMVPIFLNDDDILKLFVSKGFDPGSTMRLGRRDNSYYEGIKMWDSIHRARKNPSFNLDYLGSQCMIIISWVGGKLSDSEYFDKTPELEFFRHLRNGISHGNKFTFRGDEPRRTAKFKSFEITRALEGKTVLFEFISTGDLFDLFDHIKEHLRSLH